MSFWRLSYSIIWVVRDWRAGMWNMLWIVEEYMVLLLPFNIMREFVSLLSVTWQFSVSHASKKKNRQKSSYCIRVIYPDCLENSSYKIRSGKSICRMLKIHGAPFNTLRFCYRSSRKPPQTCRAFRNEGLCHSTGKEPGWAEVVGEDRVCIE